MAKGQMRVAKEKKKPKADKDKPKQLSAYKLAQMQGASGSPYGNPPVNLSPGGSFLASAAISRQVSNST